MTNSSSAAGEPSPAANPSTDSPPSGWIASLLERLGKLNLANQARLMADNQRILNTTHAAERDHRAFQSRLRDAYAAEVTPLGKAMEFPRDEDMEIRFDSPQTTNHYHQQPSRNGWRDLAVAVIASLLAGGATAGGLSLSGVFSRDETPAPVERPASDTDTQYEMRLLPETN